MSAYADARPDIARVALIRDLTDELAVQFPALRQAGHGKRREIAARVVDAALARQEGHQP